MTMKTIALGNKFTMRLRVTEEMTARFFDCTIHPLYATFAVVEHAEYAARQAILQYLDHDEDAVGTTVEVEHLEPTPVGWIVHVSAEIIEVEGKTITCSFEAKNKNGIIARGIQKQRVVSKERLRQRITQLEQEAETGEDE